MNNLIKLSFITVLAISTVGCKEKPEPRMEGKVKRQVIAFSPKVTGRILSINVEEGDRVKRGDTLAVLDVPEANAKLSQIKGKLKAAEAQRKMTQNGATTNQLTQLKAKKTGLEEQFLYAQKSLHRASAMVKDSMMSPQAFDEVNAKYQGAKAQLTAVNAELNEAVSGVRYETKLAAQGQEDQALGAMEEVQIALSERYIIATNDMNIETISLSEGELATAGFPLFNGYIPNEVYFRFSIPEHKIADFEKGKIIQMNLPFLNQTTEGRIVSIKQLTRYANITAAYPDYKIEEAVYEVKIVPSNIDMSEKWLTNATVLIINKKS